MKSTTRLLAPLALLLGTASADEKPNVLMILVDDLKPATGAYGDPHAKTPELDALAERGLRFERAYCNQAVCAPSRFNLMLGSHSTSTGLYDLGDHLRRELPDAVTLPQHFAAHGYRTESLGKIFHIGHGNPGDPESFEVPHFADKVVEYVLPESTGGELTREEGLFTNRGAHDENGDLRPRGAAWEAPDVEDDAYADGRVAAEAIRRLEANKDRGEPFFMAVGFVRPHMPFSAPKKYWDLYDPEKLPRAEKQTLPEGAPGFAGKRGGEISAYKPVPDHWDGRGEPEIASKLVHGYYASTSYADAQIGKVMDALDRLELADDTIVVLWGDHGFHLGELGIWTKHVNYELANRIPMIFIAPGVTEPGASTDAFAETVDIYPTLADLAGLPEPDGPQPIDGHSLVPVLEDPSSRVSDHAYHAYPRGGRLGRAIRAGDYRLVEWMDWDGDEEAVYELYRYGGDPVERENLADSMPEVLDRMKSVLHEEYPDPEKR